MVELTTLPSLSIDPIASSLTDKPGNLGLPGEPLNSGSDKQVNSRTPGTALNLGVKWKAKADRHNKAKKLLPMPTGVQPWWVSYRSLMGIIMPSW